MESSRSSHGLFFELFARGFDIAIAAEFLAVAVENLFVFSIIRNADLMILIDKRREVADN